MNAPLAKYDEARRALAEAHAIDEVKDVVDKAAAMQHYARQAKDDELIAHASRIRRRAERRLGELMGEQRDAGRLAKPPNPNVGSPKDPTIRRASPHKESARHWPTGPARARRCRRGSSSSKSPRWSWAPSPRWRARQPDEAEKRARRHDRELELSARLRRCRGGRICVPTPTHMAARAG